MANNNFLVLRAKNIDWSSQHAIGVGKWRYCIISSICIEMTIVLYVACLLLADNILFVVLINKIYALLTTKCLWVSYICIGNSAVFAVLYIKHKPSASYLSASKARKHSHWQSWMINKVKRFFYIKFGDNLQGYRIVTHYFWSILQIIPRQSSIAFVSCLKIYAFIYQ